MSSIRVSAAGFGAACRSQQKAVKQVSFREGLCRRLSALTGWDATESLRVFQELQQWAAQFPWPREGIIEMERWIRLAAMGAPIASSLGDRLVQNLAVLGLRPPPPLGITWEEIQMRKTVDRLHGIHDQGEAR